MADRVMPVSDTAELARRFSHLDPAYAADPYPFYRKLRDECPVARSDELGGFYLLSRYADVNEALRDSRRFSSRFPGIPQTEKLPLSVPPLDQDPPEHTRYRQMLLPFFTAGRAATLESLARETARQRVSQLRSGDDVYVDYCFSMPSTVLAQILGVDGSDHKRFQEWIELTVDQGQGATGSQQAHLEIFQYLADLIEQRRAAPKDDLLTFLLDVEVDGEQLSDMERLGMAQLLLIAGIDTTANTLANSIWYLAQDKEARHRLASDPSLMPSAVEEFLRIYAPVSIRRTPTQDVELSGGLVPDGEALFLLIPSANRDDRQFANPDDVLLDREHNDHIAFGAGVHRCLGVHIARMELRIGLEEFLAVVPDFELADPVDVEWKPGPIRGPKRFALRF
jgi:hypothetical protein